MLIIFKYFSAFFTSTYLDNYCAVSQASDSPNYYEGIQKCKEVMDTVTNLQTNIAGNLLTLNVEVNQLKNDQKDLQKVQADLKNELQMIENHTDVLQQRIDENSKLSSSHAASIDKMTSNLSTATYDLNIRKLETTTIVYGTFFAILAIILTVAIFLVMKQFKLVNEKLQFANNPGYNEVAARQFPSKVEIVARQSRISRRFFSEENIYEEPKLFVDNVYDDVVYFKNNDGREVIRVNGKEYLRINKNLTGNISEFRGKN